ALPRQSTDITCEHRVSYGRFAADAGGYARYDQVFDSELLQRRVQVRLVESAEACFISSDVVGLRLQLRDDVGIPCVSDQYPAFPTVGRANCLADAEFQMPRAVYRIRSPQIRKVGPIPHLQINDFHPCPT